MGEGAGILRLILFVAAYIAAGYDVLYKAARNISHGQVFDENFLMTIATVGAFFVGEYPEGVGIIILGIIICLISVLSAGLQKYFLRWRNT